jgi:hypothetical protein
MSVIPIAPGINCRKEYHWKKKKKKGIKGIKKNKKINKLYLCVLCLKTTSFFLFIFLYWNRICTVIQEIRV